ncbi:MAG: MaoC family dehydratase [Pseudomonadota bacterium]
MDAPERSTQGVYQGTSGRTYHDFEPGTTIRHTPGRTITETDNIWFTLLTMNTHPLHFDNEFAATSQFGKPLVNSCLTLSMVTGISVADISQGAIANLGWDNVRMKAPVFVGDTIYAETDVLEKRLSQSKPGQGIVSVRTRGFKADGTVFMEFDRNILVPVLGDG